MKSKTSKASSVKKEQKPQRVRATKAQSGKSFFSFLLLAGATVAVVKAFVEPPPRGGTEIWVLK